MRCISMGDTKIARNLEETNHLKVLGVYGRIILKCRLLIVIFSLRIGAGGGFLRTQYRMVGFHNRRRIS